MVEPDGDVRTQMARDTGLLEDAAANSDFVPTLRLFTFRPAGITLGHSQDPARELALDRCRRDGIDWAVRPTGGRAIFHEHEWTYSLTARIDDPDWGGSRARVYERCSALVAGSLKRLGVPAELARGVRDEAPRPGRAAAADPCFASTARHEITLEGRKLVGSAQRRTRRALLQQGSVLLGPGHLRIVDYLADVAVDRETACRQLQRRSTEAGSLLHGVTLDAWADALRLEWMSVLNTTNRVTTESAVAHA